MTSQGGLVVRVAEARLAVWDSFYTHHIDTWHNHEPLMFCTYLLYVKLWIFSSSSSGIQKIHLYNHSPILQVCIQQANIVTRPVYTIDVG